MKKKTLLRQMDMTQSYLQNPLTKRNSLKVLLRRIVVWVMRYVEFGH